MSVCAERLGIGECSKNRLAVPRVPQGTRVYDTQKGAMTWLHCHDQLSSTADLSKIMLL